jgi:thiol-disulfide isomerase/thioredoxin
MRYILVFGLILLAACKELPKKESAIKIDPIFDEEIALEVYDYNGLKPFLNRQDNKVYVVNFWATWCAPCIKELPYFEKINETYAGQGVEVLLISLDFPRQYETKLKPFLKKNKIVSKVICFDDTDQNRWIPAIDSAWSGAIPATLIYRGDKQQFYEQTFTYNELEKELLKFLD